MAEQTRAEFDVTVSHRLPESLVANVDQWAQRTWRDRAGGLPPGEYPPFFPGKRRGQLPGKVRFAFSPFQAQERWAGRPTPQATPTITSVTGPAFVSPPYPPTTTFRPSLLRLEKTARPLRVQKASSHPVIGSWSHRVMEELSRCVIEDRRDSLPALNPRPFGPGTDRGAGTPSPDGPITPWLNYPSPQKQVLYEAVNCGRRGATRGDHCDAPAIA